MSTTHYQNMLQAIEDSKPMTISYEVARKHHTSISAATYIQNNQWVIPQNHLPIFHTYYLLDWNVSYFCQELKEGIVERQGITYQVIYHRTNPAEIKKLHKIGGHVKMSFRALLTDFRVQPVVLVSLSSPMSKIQASEYKI